MNDGETDLTVPIPTRLRVLRRLNLAFYATLQSPWMGAALRFLRRFTRPVIYVGDHTVMTRTVFGNVIFLDTRDVHIFPRIALFGDWEPHVSREILRRVRPGMHAIDIGANVGYHTMVMAGCVWPGGHVTAFEAVPRTLALLQRSLAVSSHDRSTTVVGKALLDHPGKVRLQHSVCYPGSTSLYPLDPMYTFAGTDEIEVEATTLDDYLAATDGRVDFIKMDVEGAEPLVFAGMEKTLVRNPQLEIVMEFSRERFSNSGHNAAAFLQRLVDRGFRFHSIQPHQRLQRVSAEQLLELDFADVLLTRAGGDLSAGTAGR